MLAPHEGRGIFMKYFLVALTVLSASTGHACPEFTGSYKCSVKNLAQEDIKLTHKKLAGGISQYTVDAYDSVLTDGKEHAIAPTGDMKDVTYVAVCGQDGSLKIRVKGKVLASGFVVGKADLEAILKLTGTKDIKIDLAGKLLGAATAESGSCLRQ